MLHPDPHPNLLPRGEGIVERERLAGKALDGFQRLVGVTFHVTGVIDDVAEDTLLVDDVGDAANHAALFIECAKSLGRLMIRVAADEPVTQTAMLRERSLARNQINA